MVVTRRATFRLYPTPAQERQLFEWKKMHKDLYNAAVANRRTQYERFERSVDYMEQQNCLPAFKEVWPEYKALGSQALQATLKRVDVAYQKFFHKLGGYPKFKSTRHYSGWTYPGTSGWKAHTTGDNGYLELSNLGRLEKSVAAGGPGYNGFSQIHMRGKAKVWGKPTTCTIVHRHNKWYASITINCQPAFRKLGTGAIGIDFGTNTAAAVSDGKEGYFIDNPRWFKQALPKIKKASRNKRPSGSQSPTEGNPPAALSHRKRAPNRKKKIKASRRWKRSQQQVSKLYRKAANQRQNWIHHQAIELSSNSLIASEKLEVKKMTVKPKPGSKRKRQKTGLNRSILDVGWGMLKGAIKYKLEEGNGVFVEVPTKKVAPSQTCPKCSDRQKKERDERVHCCSKCGYVQDRDLAAAEVMVLWALGKLPGLGTSLANVDGSSSTVKTKVRKNCGSMRQLGQKKRSKSQLAVGDVETPTSA